MDKTDKKSSTELCFCKNPHVDYIPFQQRICLKQGCERWITASIQSFLDKPTPPQLDEGLKEPK